MQPPRPAPRQSPTPLRLAPMPVPLATNSPGCRCLGEWKPSQLVVALVLMLGTSHFGRLTFITATIIAGHGL